MAVHRTLHPVGEEHHEWPNQLVLEDHPPQDKVEGVQSLVTVHHPLEEND